MTEDDSRLYAKYYDQIYLDMKDYEKEAKIVESIVRKFESKKSETLLDVGCGTGEHLKYLSLSFRCAGIDINKNMIQTARDKVPNARFRVANMVDFRLAEKFDVITSLFSAIGHVQTVDNLVQTIRNFHNHLAQEGLVSVEP
jgi:trans-aconitate methyltransferase